MTKIDGIYFVYLNSQSHDIKNIRMIRLRFVRRWRILWKCNLLYGFNSGQNLFRLNLN